MVEEVGDWSVEKRIRIGIEAVLRVVEGGRWPVFVAKRFALRLLRRGCGKWRHNHMLSGQDVPQRYVCEPQSDQLESYMLHQKNVYKVNGGNTT